MMLYELGDTLVAVVNTAQPGYGSPIHKVIQGGLLVGWHGHVIGNVMTDANKNVGYQIIATHILHKVTVVRLDLPVTTGFEYSPEDMWFNLNYDGDEVISRGRFVNGKLFTTRRGGMWFEVLEGFVK